MDYVELTLLGGEKVLFGRGMMLGGVQVPLPPGYFASQTIALGLPGPSTDVGHPTRGIAAGVDSGGYAHSHMDDGNGNAWDGQARIMIFSFLNNGGTWRSDPSGWFHCPLPGGKALAVGGWSILDPTCNGTTPSAYVPGNLVPVTGSNTIPAMEGMTSASIQTLPGPNGFNYPADHPAHGVMRCYVDQTLSTFCSFEDGDGNTWSGAAGVFGLLCDAINPAVTGQAVPAGSGTWAGTGGSGSGGSGSGGTGSGGSGGTGGGTGGSGGGGDTGDGSWRGGRSVPPASTE